MIEEATNRLQLLCSTIPALLAEIDEETFAFKPHPDKWSKKEILGHLIDSATNNHHRFVRTQFESLPAISYDQNQWNSFGYYNQIDSAQLIEFWAAYNKQLAELLKRIPEKALSRKCKAGGNDVTLEFLINDYVVHLEHHLKQIINY
jgi:hypothetical protein